MTCPPLRIALPSAEATATLGARLAPLLGPGDVVLLAGPIGAGKTHLARALIQARLAAEGRHEDVPSPTFTLVQTYATATTEIWHADLYRLTHPDEVWELGLEAAFDTAICLVEWPDRLGRAAPADALLVTLADDGAGRVAVLSGPDRWAGVLARVARAAAADAFCAAAGWDVPRAFLAGDASARRYERLTRAACDTAVLMDAPPDAGEDVGAFLRVGAHLRALGLSAPAVLAADAAAGFVLLEDLGDALFTRLLAEDPGREAALYAAAVDVLLTVARAAPLPGLPVYDAAAMAAAVAPAAAWYRLALTGMADGTAELTGAMGAALAALPQEPAVMILRDYHADNLLWLPDRAGVARVGVLDFQLAMLGHPVFDLVSLLQDARRDVGPGTQAAMIARFAAATGRDPAALALACATVGAQRHLRILGVFARLSLHLGKPGYADFLPRIWRDLQADLAHPALAGLAAVVARLLPPPTPANIQRIKDQCGTIPTP